MPFLLEKHMEETRERGTLLAANVTQQKMHLTIGRVGLKDLPAQRLRADKIASLMKLPGLSYRFGDRGHEDRSHSGNRFD